ncbi:hypothetical protein NSE_0030 [Neorickettsia sennetsu str. Miyayama]|uniref:Uncharacterized protein n=1 Tax=Ehrlichia sennetsu (strain ATCC VR-367 / Miyayama) TaxID=222891 RepID=Q2GF23_EHRS3|nr:hypothetical protein NSE_0030 [Neorickettsia sennetsu str. Miyayama]
MHLPSYCKILDIYESEPSSLHCLGTNISGFNKILRRSSVIHN